MSDEPTESAPAKPATGRLNASDALSTVDRHNQLAAASGEMTKVLTQMSGQLGNLGGGAAKSLTKAAESAEVVGASVRRLLTSVFATPIVLLIRLVLVPMRLVQGLLGKATGSMGEAPADDDEDPVDWDEEMAPKVTEPARELKDFNDLLEKNIIFFDNQKMPLFSSNMTRGLGTLGRQQQEFIMELCLNAIKECAPLTAGMPPVEKGRFAGQMMEDILSDIAGEDVKRFITFGYKYASSYSGKNFRLSETFATWLMNGAPDD
ncbi:MAG: hypothetical protein H7338_19165 [Candidatus Sericytochromatia bacterium]|nr:hypothetical protein [Candidatus Sericytochromatia bacterium]